MPAPAPKSIAPSAGYAGDQTPVTIKGDSFLAQATQSLDPSVSPAIRSDFRAWLGETELLSVSRVDASTLTATVPAGMAAGKYALRVEGPFGSGTLPDAFEAVSLPNAALEATLTLSAPVHKQPATATAVVTNVGGRAALGVSLAGSPSILQADVTLPPANLPVDLAPGGSVQVVWQLLAAGGGTLSMTVSFAGTDALDGHAVTCSASASAKIAPP